ncbi:retrovirus-related pol polyprotein from transposon TNT 1-94 [Tanacetum coccineum]|uniref:Retrovirus-related pol polyprotein from transposon TNT 1-94 n=1 Tax=Tanacetum coccineum TaxID=301880 RepID=A0ABQ5C286_9ASTR
MGIFLRLKDETPEIIKKFIAQVQLNYNAKVHKIRTDKGTEFKNATLKAHYERRNRTLIEVVHSMLIFLRLPEFIWAEAISTACSTQNRSINHTRYNKTPYEFLHGRKLNVEYFHVFGSLCYPKNDRDDLGKIKPKADIRIFIGYSETSRGFRIYNGRTKKITKTIHVKYDELTAMASEHDKQEALPIVTTSEEQTSPILMNEADDLNQEDSTEFDGNTLLTSYDAPEFAKAESPTTALDPSNMHNVSTFEPKNIKEAMSDHSWIESMQDELHQFKRLDVWEPIPRLDGKNIIEEGINIEESFAYVVRHEAVRTLKKAQYGLKQAPQVHQSPCDIFISQSQYTIELLKKHGMDDCVSISTPMATKRLDADLQGTPTD